MKTYRITFTSGFQFEYEAASIEDDGRTLLMRDEAGSVIVKYQDSEILSCEAVEDALVSDGLDDGEVLHVFDEDGERVSAIRKRAFVLVQAFQQRG